jgi:ornithine carbamoyltransferase
MRTSFTVIREKILLSKKCMIVEVGKMSRNILAVMVCVCLVLGAAVVFAGPKNIAVKNGNTATIGSTNANPQAGQHRHHHNKSAQSGQASQANNAFGPNDAQIAAQSLGQSSRAK